MKMHLPRRPVRVGLAACSLIGLSVVVAGPAGAAGLVQGNSASYEPSVSADGRYVAFTSYASNLVAGDTNGALDVFVRDRSANTTTRVSVSSSGAQGNGGSEQPSISENGRYVAFTSYADNLVARDSNLTYDVFVRDLLRRTTVRVSVSSSEAAGNDRSLRPAISADGRYVAFESRASNLVGRDTNGRTDIFVRDRTAKTTARVSVTPRGAQSNGDSTNADISRDGQVVSFASTASNFDMDFPARYGIYVRDRIARTTTVVAAIGEQDGCGALYDPRLSTDGQYVTYGFLGGCDTDRYSAYRQYWRTGEANVVDASAFGCPIGGISQDGVGSRIAYWEQCLQQVIVHDWATGRDQRLSVPSDARTETSADGRSIAIATGAALTADDTNGAYDVYVWTPELNRLRRVSVG